MEVKLNLVLSQTSFKFSVKMTKTQSCGAPKELVSKCNERSHPKPKKS